MSTPVNAPYKLKQRAAKRAVRNRGEILWISNQIYRGIDINGMPFGPWMKRKIQGTRIGSFN